MPANGRWDLIRRLKVNLVSARFIMICGARPHWEQVAVTILWFVPVAVDTVEHCTPVDGCAWRPKHVE